MWALSEARRATRSQAILGDDRGDGAHAGHAQGAAEARRLAGESPIAAVALAFPARPEARRSVLSRARVRSLHTPRRRAGA